jgi:hypothetical protein
MIRVPLFDLKFLNELAATRQELQIGGTRLLRSARMVAPARRPIWSKVQEQVRFLAVFLPGLRKLILATEWILPKIRIPEPVRPGDGNEYARRQQT